MACAFPAFFLHHLLIMGQILEGFETMQTWVTIKMLLAQMDFTQIFIAY